MKTVKLSKSAEKFFSENTDAEIAFNADLTRHDFKEEKEMKSFFLYQGLVFDKESQTPVAFIKKSLQKMLSDGIKPEAVCFTQLVNRAGEVVNYLLREKSLGNLNKEDIITETSSRI